MKTTEQPTLGDLPNQIAPAVVPIVAEQTAVGTQNDAINSAQSEIEKIEAVTAPVTTPLPASWLWLRGHDQVFVGVCVAFFLVLSGYHWARLSGWGSVPLEVDRLPERRYDFQININAASWIEFAQIEGIGEITAKKIIADRDAHGPFQNIANLQRVKGIGPKTLDRMRPFLQNNSNQLRPTQPSPIPQQDDFRIPSDDD